MTKATLPSLLGLIALCLPACDKVTDFGELSELEGNPQSAPLQCDSPDTIEYAHAIAISAERYYQQRDEAYVAEFGAEVEPEHSPHSEGTMVVTLSSDAALSCDTHTFDGYPDINNRMVRLFLLPQMLEPGTHSLDDWYGDELAEQSVSGPLVYEEDGGALVGGSLPGQVQIRSIDDESIEGTVCFADPEDEYIGDLGFDPSTPFFVTVCPE